MRILPTCLCIAALGTASLTPTPAAANELSRSDKLRVLYSNQFAFDRNGVPLITVRIAEGQGSTTIESTSPVRVFPDGEDGSEVLGGKRWRITLRSARAATLEHFVVLAREPTGELAGLQQKMKQWRGRGARCRMIETGTIFGLRGKVFDNRSYVLADGPYSSQKQALRAAERYKQRHGLDRIATLPQLKRRPSATFEATDLDTSARVLVRDAIWFAPSGEAQLAVRGEDGRPAAYWGQIYVTVDRGGKLAVVNAAPANRLLAGLVPAEIFPSAPAAALRAQSVAARGELLAKLGTRHLVDPYLLCSTQHCQVYRGAGHEHPRTSKAVNATKGMVLVRKDGRLVDTVYSASCGGHTEHNDNVWPVKPDPNLRGTLDADGSPAYRGGITSSNIEAWLTSRPRAWCNHPRYNRDKFRWVAHLSVERAGRLLAELGVGELRDIRVVSRGVSGRASLVEVEGSRSRAQIRGELNIRRTLGNLRSSMFMVKTVTTTDGRVREFVFRGGGWGHGVGMCQTGAIGMAEARKGHEMILQHYYQGSALQPLY